MIEPDGAGSEIRISLEYELPGEIVGSLFGLLTGNRIEREFRRTSFTGEGWRDTGKAAALPQAGSLSRRLHCVAEA